MKKIVFIMLALCMIIVMCACDSALEPAQLDTADQNQEEVETASEKQTQAPTPTPEPTPEPIPEGVEHVNILLIGANDKDFSKEGNTNPLTHILITLDPDNKAIKFTTFPYNLAIEVESEDGTNTAQLQRVATAVDQEKLIGILEDNFGIDIDHWVLMNMRGVVDIVDAVQGIEIDIEKISMNDMIKHMMGVLGEAWQEVTQTGLQTLTGVQTAGYFVDTMTETDDGMTEEETYFRDHHPNIINGVIGSVRALGLTGDDLITIANNVSGNYITSISQDEWQAIADTAVYCIQNDAQFLHIPQEISVSEMGIVFDKEADTAAVQAFVSETE